jgi:hypothetical protein
MGGHLGHTIERAAHILPAQGPITTFIHHNPLHAFEHLPFEEAVVVAAERLGCEPFLDEDFYRSELRAGRILRGDLSAVLREELGERGEELVGGLALRGELRLAWLEHGVPEAQGPALEWLLGETEVLEGRRPLWEACIAAVARVAAAPPPAPPRPTRHRDHLVAAFGADPDALVHPLLTRLCAAYLDQGIAPWPIPGREHGFFRCVTRLYGLPGGPSGPWMRAVRDLFRGEAESDRSALESIARSLEALGVGPDEDEAFLTETGLALRGWAGMMRQVEERPDRVPVHAPPATFADFLAVRLLLDRAAASEVLRTESPGGPGLAELRVALAGRLPRPDPPTDAERAWPLFHLARILGRGPADVAALAPDAAGDLLGEIASFDGTSRRRLMHRAYEQTLRHRFLDAMAAHVPWLSSPCRFQALFCLDEREESIRRHLEEVAPDCETFGAAGFFGVAMYYRGAEEIHARPLCPVGIRPRHEVEESPGGGGGRWKLRPRLRRAWGRLDLGMALGGRTLLRGTVGTALFGALATLPLFLRVLFPWLAARAAHGGRSLLTGSGARGRLEVRRREVTPSLGEHAGYTTEEMAAVVRGVLQDAGLVRLAPLVVIAGHGSTSLSNPHESAHDCGACGGGRGGPNARAFAAMANDPEVRRLLAAQGLAIPDATWFAGAEHNTATDGVAWFDLDLAPPGIRPLVREASGALAEAATRNAHERCRRFRAVPLRTPKRLCLAHVETRAEDLAQTRPEYGHATNAFCVVGRRARTRGLFLDRRAFLVSYDPTADGDGSGLARLLEAVVPVVAGISLEYWFAYVDAAGYGSGTKLPHNVTALLGVMDGHRSDLRTGLPRQMTEIHEPVRLTLLVESPAGRLAQVVAGSEMVSRLVANGWIAVAALDPHSGAIHELGPAGPAHYVARGQPLPQVPDSAAWYRGRRDFLGFARITPARPRGAHR